VLRPRPPDWLDAGSAISMTSRGTRPSPRCSAGGASACQPTTVATLPRLTVLLVLLVAGCGGQADESTTAGQSATSTTVAPTTTTKYG
jgi:hypothetical protein